VFGLAFNITRPPGDRRLLITGRGPFGDAGLITPIQSFSLLPGFGYS